MPPTAPQTPHTAYDREQRIEIEYPDLTRERLPQVVRFVRATPPRRGFFCSAWPGGVTC